ncbi:MAG: helix-turn-helix domain-containing protein [Firmicutes bacterium]|nr:helix-turn-helix domain-containing protein [Bacillota bacterium]
MTDTFELEKVIRQNGYTKKQIAKEIGLSEQGFLLKLNNKREFKASEIQKICILLKCSRDIFFVSEVNLIHS